MTVSYAPDSLPRTSSPIDADRSGAKENRRYGIKQLAVCPSELGTMRSDSRELLWFHPDSLCHEGLRGMPRRVASRRYKTASLACWHNDRISLRFVT